MDFLLWLSGVFLGLGVGSYIAVYIMIKYFDKEISKSHDTRLKKE